MHPDPEELKILGRQRCSLTAGHKNYKLDQTTPDKRDTKLALLQPRMQSRLLADMRPGGFSKVPAVMITVGETL